jgi:hypothetical protein
MEGALVGLLRVHTRVFVIKVPRIDFTVSGENFENKIDETV